MKPIFKAVTTLAILTILVTTARAGLVNRIEAAQDHAQPGDRDCRNASGRADHLEESILDLKARYWALRLRKGPARDNGLADPSATITDRGLRARFYGTLQSYYASAATTSLTPAEVQRFVAADETAFNLLAQCSL